MSNRPVRSLKKLYDLNNILFELERFVERSSRIQGPFEESDFEHQRMSPGKFTDQNRVMFSGDTRVESGTCNVCSAPCSSCMHRRAVAMETSVDCGSSDTTFLRKEGDNCSFNGVNHRSCNELRTAASETSNLLSGSSNDSCCENAESKATLRDSFTCDNSEAVDMLPEVSTVKTIKEETFSEKRISDVGFEMSCTDSRVMQDGEFDEGHRMSTCHKNNDSCTSEATYGNMLDLDLDKRDTPCSSLSTPKCSTKETEMMIQVEKVTHESRVCLAETNMINSTKLNGLLREPFHKKSPGPINVNFSTKSDLSNPSSRKNILSKLTSNSPSLSNHISSENPEDSIDLDATKPSNFQGASHECLVVKDEASAGDLLSTDNEVSKSIHIKIGAPSLESKNEEQCAISATDFGRSEYSLHTSETQLQPILDGRASDLDNMLFDVKVCDICGDAGREELLATCSRCVDGAEHTYCMRIMLDKVPEGDWFCEECQLKEKVATRKLNEAEPKFGTSSVPSLNKKIQNLGNFTNIESSRKLVVGSSIPETSASIKEMESPRITSKRHVDQVDDSSTARKKVSEPKYESTKLATPKVDTVFSRVGSSRNLHVAEAKGSSATLSSESRRTNVSRTFSCSLKLDSRGNSFKNLHVAEATRSSKNSSPVGQSTNSWTLSRSPSGSLSRQISFRKNFEPKVKKLMEGVPRNLTKDSTSKDKKMLAVARRQLSKSASFNSVSSEHQNIGTIIKAQSFKSRLEDPLILKPIKERNISFVSDYPDVVQPPNKRMHLPKMDSKTAVPTRDLNNEFESNTLDGGRSENNSGYNEAKKQSSFKCERHGIYDSEDKRAGDLIKNKATPVDSGATDTSYKEVGGVTNNVSLADCSLQVQSDDKVIVTSSPGASRAPNSVIKPVLVHDKPKETIHSSQCCEIDKLASTAAKPSVVVSLVEGTTKKNKWKDAAKAAMLERKRSRTVDQSESMSNNVIYEGPSQSTLTNSSCQKDLPLVGAGASCGKEVVRDSYSDYSKTEGADVQQIKHSMESSYVPAVEGTTKKNKWKDAAKAAMLERKRSRTVDQSESMSNNRIYEGPSQSTLTNSSCQKDLPLVGAGASCGKEVVRDSYTDYSKTDGADVQQIKHSMESSYVPAVEGRTKKNKWKDVAKAAMLERKRSRTVDQSESMSNNIIYEGPSQSTLTNSSCQKDLPLVGAGASCGKEVVRDSYTDYSKTDGADVQQIKHSMESSYVPAVEGRTKKNKWKDVAKAAMLERKRSRTVDQSESMSNNIIYEGPSQSTLTNSSCQKDLPLVGAGASCGKEVVGDSYTDYSKTDGADVQQIKHSMESSYVPAVVDLNADPTIIHDSIEKSTIQILSDHPSLFTTTCRALAIPEHEFIWQGAFEILRIGRLPETVDGIQAHLSNVSSPKVHELACQFPCKIQLEEVPRVSLWPLQFQDIGPEENDIALYFFAKDAESYEKSYQKLLEAAVNNDLALKGNINEMELLIFPSSMLPASSQRWNMLFFLWGIFRVRKSDSSIPCASLRERPCGTKTTAEPHDEDVSPPACELSTFQQPNSQRYPPKEVSRSNESCGASRMKHDSSVDCHAVSSTSPENNIHKVEDLHYKSVAETETTDLSVDSSHSCSKSYSFNQKERCSAEEIYETKLGNKNTEFDLARVPLINANDEHKLSKSSPGYAIASCFREDEEIKKGRLVKIEAESEVKLTDGVCPSWVSRPNRKRALSCSETISGEVSESTKAIMWQPKESCFVCTEDDRDHKRMNCNSEGPASNNCRVASMERNFPSSTRCSYEQRSDGANYNNVIESTKCPERCFFPVDSHRVGSDAVENFRFFLPPVNEESPHSSIPDLELALGGKKSSSRKQTVSLFSPSVDRGKLGKLSGSIFDDDDMSEALSLSLAFPSVDRKRTDDTEQKDQPTVNTHLFLFGGFTDA